MGLSGVTPLGEVKTKAPNSDYHNHKDEPPVSARQAGLARDYLKRAARIDELNGHPPHSDGQVVAALKRHNWGRVLVFEMGAFAEMSGDVSRICDIIADLARTHVSYYNDDAKRIKGIAGSASRGPWGTGRTAVWPVSSSTAPGTSSPTARRTAARTARRCRRTRTTRTAASSITTPRGGLLRCLGARSPCYCCSDPTPPH